MALFLVATRIPENDAQIEQAIKARFPNDHFVLGRGQWIVASEGTARQLSSELGIVPEGPDTAGQTLAPIRNTIVFNVTAYWGRSPSDVWEWLATKGEQVKLGKG